MKKIVFIANLDNGIGMSGGTKIYLELLKRLNFKFETYLFGSKGTIKFLQSQKIKIKRCIRTDNDDSVNLFSLVGLLKHSIRRLFHGVRSVRKNYNTTKSTDYVFSVSDFWPDILPALFLKWKNPRIKWIAAFYFFAPKPWQKDNPYATSLGRRIVGFVYWLTQLFAYWAIKRWADLVIACNELDRKIFIHDGFPAGRIIAIYGGVDLDFIKSVPSPIKKKYDAIFMARFHPQKAPLVAVKAWEELVKTFPKAKLAMIGNGPEEAAVSSYISKKHLTDNISLLGFLDGKQKYQTLKSARIFIHPAIYETGGMAAAEGMACGLPVIAFNHEGFKYCYPQGMLKISPIGDSHKFALAIRELMVNKKKYDTIRKQAIHLVENEWDWSKRASLILSTLKNV